MVPGKIEHKPVMRIDSEWRNIHTIPGYPTGIRLPLPVWTLLLLVVSGCARSPLEPADTIFWGGSIVTMESEKPEAQAIAIKEGRILAIGNKREIKRRRGPQTHVLDLKGKALLPGFIDAHGHLSLMAQVVALCNIASPPVGPVNDFSDLKRELVAYAERNSIPPGSWVVGFGYDDSLLAEGRHPTRTDLDAMLPDHPVALIHVSAHLATLNSAALAASKITASMPNPPGGVIRRQPSSEEPDGVLEESAMMIALSRLPQPSDEQQLALLDLAQREYAENGITTAQDGFTQPRDLKLLQKANAEHRLIMDVVAYPGWPFAKGMIGDRPVGVYDQRLKIGGVKLVLDGSPQGKTAYLTQPYHVPPPGQDEGYRGYPAMSDEKVDQWVDTFFSQNWQVLAHCNGDAAAEQLINAVEKGAAKYGLENRRTVMIHAQTVRDDQLDRMADSSIMPSFFSAHAFYWGDWHRDSVLGPERAKRISPARSTIDRGMPFTIHNDSPVVPPDMMRLISAAVNRRTRSGQVLGEEQRLKVGEALRAVTLDAAFQNFEEADKGSLKAGKLANLVVLSSDPRRIKPGELEDILVEETWIEGARVYSRSDSEAELSGASDASPNPV